jgi:diguanylate cyclase (GGDEF)-like protein
MPNFIVQIVIIIAFVILLASFQPLSRIHKMLPTGATRRAWSALAVIISFCATGFLVFLSINIMEGPDHHEDWLISFMFLGASLFVFIVCNVSHTTARDVCRIASLELAASIDPVTNLYNRLHMMSLLDTECSRSSRDKSPVSVLLLDIDSFKEMNDRYGHAGGDVVLARMGEIIKASVPNGRYVGRYGGDEFLVILPHAASAQAFAIAERVRSAIENSQLSYAGEPAMSLTASIGVATGFGWQECAQELVALADEALYAAKTVRNKVCHTFEPSGKKIASLITLTSPHIQ